MAPCGTSTASYPSTGSDTGFEELCILDDSGCGSIQPVSALMLRMLEASPWPTSLGSSLLEAAPILALGISNGSPRSQAGRPSGALVASCGVLRRREFSVAVVDDHRTLLIRDWINDRPNPRASNSAESGTPVEGLVGLDEAGAGCTTSDARWLRCNNRGLPLELTRRPPRRGGCCLSSVPHPLLCAPSEIRTAYDSGPSPSTFSPGNAPSASLPWPREVVRNLAKTATCRVALWLSSDGSGVNVRNELSDGRILDEAATLLCATL